MATKKLARALVACFFALYACSSQQHVVPLDEVTASSVAKAASSSQTLTVSGTISAVYGSYFTLKTTQCGYLHIYYTSSTAIVPNGSTLAVGASAQATGVGSCSTSLNATSITLANASATSAVPNHLLTADYMRSSSTINDVIYPVSTYTKYLSYTDTTPNVANQFAAAGVKTMFYNDPNRVETGYPMYTSDEAAYAHDCSGNRIHAVNYSGLMLMDPSSPDTVNLWKTTSEQILSSAHFDYIFEDDANDLYALAGTPCNYNASAWLTASQNEIAAMPFPVIYNDLNNVDANYDMPANLALNSVAPGGMMENCYVQTTSGKDGGGFWKTTENVELQMAAAKKLFFCFSGNQTTASSATGQDYRMYLLGSFLLTYDPNTSVLWDRFWMHSNFRVQPESALVALNPAVPAPATIDALRTSGGAYERKFTACYLAGIFQGPCAVEVNSSGSSETDPIAGVYHHTLSLSGGGVLDGGTVSILGGPPPQPLPAKEAIIAFP